MTRRPDIGVYVACAMSAPTKAQFMKNCRRANRAAWRLTKLGYLVFSPALGAFFEKDGGDLSWDKWLAFDESIISRLDIVYRLLPDPAGRTSSGAEREVRYAKRHGIPVVTSEMELRRVARSIRAARKVAA